jgi:hypothetical protein
MADEKTGENWYLLAGIATGAVAIIAGIATLSLMSGSPTLPAADGVVVSDSAVASVEPATSGGETKTKVTDAPPVSVEAPTFDAVRVESDGSALVAGRAPPEASLRVMIDGAEVATGTADASGSFAAMFALPPSTAPRLMTLEAVLPDGRVSVSKDSVAIAPTKAPVATAAVRSEPATDQMTGTATDGGAVASVEPAPSSAPATLLVTESGASLIQPPEPVTPDQTEKDSVSIDTIAYTPGGGVQLSGKAGAGALLRIYLDNGELMTLTAPGSGPWTATLPDVAPGIYTLRVDQVGPDGAVTSRFETPFKRETPQALAAAAAQETTPVAAVDVAKAAPVASADAPEAPALDVAQAPAPDTTQPEAPALSAEITSADETEAPSEGIAAPTPEPAAEPSANVVTVTVQPGFSLWKIARESYGNGVMYVQVFEANKEKIKDPDLIYPGQVFTMPATP